MKKYTFVVLLVGLISCNGNSENKVSQASQQNTSSTSGINEQGQHLFKVNCIQCHMPAKDFAAPGLAGVEKRWKNKELLYEFVKNSSAVIEKDTYAKELFEKWKQAPMTPFPHLSNEEIDAIFEYCNQMAENN